MKELAAAIFSLDPESLGFGMEANVAAAGIEESGARAGSHGVDFGGGAAENLERPALQFDELKIVVVPGKEGVDSLGAHQLSELLSVALLGGAVNVLAVVD